MAASVTIAKTYFEALLRRAEFHVPQNLEEALAGADPAYITISSNEHQRLLHDARAYREYLSYVLTIHLNSLRGKRTLNWSHMETDTLCKALLRGGVSQNTLDMLASAADADDFTQNGGRELEIESEQQYGQHGAPRKPIAPPTVLSGSSYRTTTDDVQHTIGRNASDSLPPSGARQGSFEAFSSLQSNEKDDFTTVGSQALRPSLAPSEQRTLLLTNLSDRTTHKDITNVVRGGRLLEVFIRHDRSATVSFVEGAQDFYAYVKRNDIYIHTKRVEVRWHDRQFHVHNHIATRLAHGATRNIVIRGVDAKISEQRVRNDLDHIHNLVVIDVRFESGDMFISTNSLHNALYARTCMMSRSAYKGLRIEWYPDECAAALPKAQGPRFKEQGSQAQSRATALAPLTNRFHLLKLDESEPSSDEGDDEQCRTGLPEYGVDLNWADEGLVA